MTRGRYAKVPGKQRTLTRKLQVMS